MNRTFICLLLVVMLPFVLAATGETRIRIVIPTLFSVEAKHEDTLHVLVKTNAPRWEMIIDGDVEWRIADSDDEFQSSEIPIITGVAGDHSPGVDFELRGDFEELTLRWYSLEDGVGSEVEICQ